MKLTRQQEEMLIAIGLCQVIAQAAKSQYEKPKVKRAKKNGAHMKSAKARKEQSKRMKAYWRELRKNSK